MVEINRGVSYKTNLERYDSAEVLPAHDKEILKAVKAMIKTKDRYSVVGALTGVPWFVVGCIHRRERDQAWDACLHNGDEAIGNGKKTWNVPAGRGPFNTWEEAAVDALKIKLVGKFKNPTWDLGTILEFCERYNGLGYRRRGVASPYMYCYTTAYKGGQFRKDHIYDPAFWEQRPGIVSMIKVLSWLSEIKIADKDVA